MRVEKIGDATLHLGDCREIVPTLPRPGALIGDPPYGQKHKVNVHAVGDRIIRRSLYRGHEVKTTYPDMPSDQRPFEPLTWLSAADVVLLWGAHKFADRLPPGQFLVWDKVPTGKRRCQGDGEAAWLNADRPMRIFRLLWDGLCVGSAARPEVTAGVKRVHPMQKPVAVMSWCIEQAMLASGASILDPWMGAGSTGIAALQRGHPFVGIEIEPRYFDIACRRIAATVQAMEGGKPPPVIRQLHGKARAPHGALRI